MSDEYEQGRRDAELKTCHEERKKMWQRLDALEGWKNRAIGYSAAIATLLTSILQWALRHFGERQ